MQRFCFHVSQHGPRHEFNLKTSFFLCFYLDAAIVIPTNAVIITNLEKYVVLLVSNDAFVITAVSTYVSLMHDFLL